MVNELLSLIAFIENNILVQAIVIAVAFLIVFRITVAILFNYRTKLLGAIEETYKLHVKELQEMYDEKGESEEECKKMLKEVKTELSHVRSDMSTLVNLWRKYSCSNAPECNNHVDVSYDFCKDCVNTDKCDECTFASEFRTK